MHYIISYIPTFLFHRNIVACRMHIVCYSYCSCVHFWPTAVCYPYFSFAILQFTFVLHINNNITLPSSHMQWSLIVHIPADRSQM